MVQFHLIVGKIGLNYLQNVNYKLLKRKGGFVNFKVTEYNMICGKFYVA